MASELEDVAEERRLRRVGVSGSIPDPLGEGSSPELEGDGAGER